MLDADRAGFWFRALRAAGATVVMGLALVACKPTAEASASSRAVSNEAQRASKPAVGEMIAVPARVLLAGSSPGSASRNPSVEADLVPIALTAFEIDRSPHPNDPTRPALTGIDQMSASAACGKVGKRMCSELEWESACDSEKAFLTPLVEWTASSIGASRIAIRGAGRSAGADEAARCSGRVEADATSTAPERGFRCCRGAAQSAGYPHPALERAPVTPLTLSVEDTCKALAQLPGQKTLNALAAAFTPFGDSDVSAALRRGKRGREGITAVAILPAAIAWSPAPGEDLIVITGRSGRDALLVALYPLGDGSYAHAASAILAQEPDATFALSYREGARNELGWTTCYGCPTEGGAIRYARGRVTIEFR